MLWDSQNLLFNDQQGLTKERIRATYASKLSRPIPLLKV